MRRQAEACNPDRIRQFLDEGLSDSDQSAFELHLTDCPACRGLLSGQTADHEFWDKASRYLRDEDTETLQGSSWSSVSLESSANLSHCIQQVLDSLTPSDHPEMLGRLGSYEISGVVGAGGMGVVLRAHDPSLDRTVGIKVLGPHLATSAAARKRFSREAKAAAAVLHPNVMAIHGVSNEGSLPYLVMQYVRGTSLQKRIDDEGSLSLSEILRIGSQIAAGLAAAHAQGLVHRDIKPANILLEEGVERVAITDFGLARAVDDASMTRTGIIAGTPQFMSPEQARGEAIDQRSDLFSLGSVMYMMCTGRPPFRADTSYGILRRITDVDPRPIQEINASVPTWLCQVIDNLMAKDLDDRFASADKVAGLLEECLAHVQQPSVISLPRSLEELDDRSRSVSARQVGGFVAVGLSAVVTLVALAAFLLPNPRVPDAQGRPNANHTNPIPASTITHGSQSEAWRDGVSEQILQLREGADSLESRAESLWDAPF